MCSPRKRSTHSEPSPPPPSQATVAELIQYGISQAAAEDAVAKHQGAAEAAKQVQAYRQAAQQQTAQQQASLGEGLGRRSKSTAKSESDSTDAEQDPRLPVPETKRNQQLNRRLNGSKTDQDSVNRDNEDSDADVTESTNATSETSRARTPTGLRCCDEDFSASTSRGSTQGRTARARARAKSTSLGSISTCTRVDTSTGLGIDRVVLYTDAFEVHTEDHISVRTEEDLAYDLYYIPQSAELRQGVNATVDTDLGGVNSVKISANSNGTRKGREIRISVTLPTVLRGDNRFEVSPQQAVLALHKVEQHLEARGVEVDLSQAVISELECTKTRHVPRHVREYAAVLEQQKIPYLKQNTFTAEDGSRTLYWNSSTRGLKVYDKGLQLDGESSSLMRIEYTLKRRRIYDKLPGQGHAETVLRCWSDVEVLYDNIFDKLTKGAATNKRLQEIKHAFSRPASRSVSSSLREERQPKPKSNMPKYRHLPKPQGAESIGSSDSGEHQYIKHKIPPAAERRSRSKSPPPPKTL